MKLSGNEPTSPPSRRNRVTLSVLVPSRQVLLQGLLTAKTHFLHSQLAVLGGAGVLHMYICICVLKYMDTYFRAERRRSLGKPPLSPSVRRPHTATTSGSPILSSARDLARCRGAHVPAASLVDEYPTLADFQGLPASCYEDEVRNRKQGPPLHESPMLWSIARLRLIFLCMCFAPPPWHRTWLGQRLHPSSRAGQSCHASNPLPKWRLPPVVSAPLLIPEGMSCCVAKLTASTLTILLGVADVGDGFSLFPP